MGRLAGCALIVLGIAFVATLTSVLYQRPYRGVIGNLCEKTQENPLGYCYDALPAGGVPVAWLRDFGTVSVSHQLGPEDHFVAWAFVVDLGFFAALFAAAALLYRRRRGR